MTELRVLRVAHHAVVSAWRQRERELRALGVDVGLVSSRRWNEGGRELELELEGDDFVVGARTIGRHPSVFLYDPRPIWRALSAGVDLIDIHEEPNALATAEILLLRRLRGSRAPYLLYSAQNLKKRYPVPFRWFERGALSGAAGAYVCNTEAADILREKGLAGDARYLPLGVDTSRFTPAERRAPTGRPTVGYVGRLERHKGVDVLLRAIAARPELRLRVVGDGPQRAELEALRDELALGARVEFVGFAAGDALVGHYRDFDVLAVPSLPWPGWREQFCRVAVEAMACGVPVVGSRSGAIPDVVGGAGVLVEPGDVSAWTTALDEALEPRRWAQLRAAALERAPLFTWKSVAREQRRFYEEVRPMSAARERPEVLIVAYGDAAPLAECLDALGAELSVTIVDNSSLPATKALAVEYDARYVDAGANLGFAGGVNLGLSDLAARGLRGRDVLLLNPDARIDDAGVRTLEARLASAPDIAAVGATQEEPGSAVPVRVWWPFPTPFGAWVEAVGLGAVRRSRDFAIGSILLLRSEALHALGGLDERFFLYAEETDWQFRARRSGWRIEVAEVRASHEGAGTGGDPRVREAHFYGSAERYLRKHYGAAGWQSYRLANVLGAGARAIALRGDAGRAAARRARIFARGPVRAEREATA
ncbi:glycosyltransferase [Gryllotalpicola reticulitermitis]|uniref:D-inositol 3-phosphate glycosyltransferase n=1 Tax=Gryllotalpicola reticulitermitis TaxID=1184153 RepID=A0ABV8Q894_9MICO